MNFNQWKGYAAKGAVAKVTYCCGDQPALIELVLDDIKKILAVPVTDYVEVDASKDKSFWEYAGQYPLDPDVKRLVVVRNAEVIEDWSNLDNWLIMSKANPNNYLLFISNQSDAQGIYDKGKRISYVEHIETIRKKGKFIKCVQPNDDDLVTWAKSFGLTETSAKHLVNRLSGDTASMLNVLRKVHIWNGSPNTNALDLLCSELALDSFSDYLILRDKPTALLALASISEDDKSKIITKLNYRLDMLTELAGYVRRRVYANDIASATGIKIYLVKRFTPVVKNYDDKKIRMCRQLLALVDNALQNGVKTGAWEVLIALW